MDTDLVTRAQGGDEEAFASGLIGADECNVVAVTTGGRGYWIELLTSGDEAWLDSTYDRAWFEEVLATVQLHPKKAVDTPPS